MFEALLGPVGHWELTRAARRPTFLLMRPLVVVAAIVPLAFAIWATFPTGACPAPEMADRWASFTPRFTVPVLHVTFLAATLSVPVIFAPLLAAERERRTLDVLLMTGQRTERVVYGRWLAGLAQTLSIVVAPAPVLIAGTLYGGLDAPRIARVLLLLALSVMTLSALTLLVSSFTRNLRETWAGLLSIIVLVQIVPESAAGIGQFLVRFDLLSHSMLHRLLAAIDELRERFHPWLLLAEELSAKNEDHGLDARRLGWFALGHLLATALFLRLTVLVISRAQDFGAALRRPRLFPTPRRFEFGDRPVLAREWRLGSGGVWERWLDRMLTAATLIAFWLPIYGEWLRPWPKLYRFLGQFTANDLLHFLPWMGGVLGALTLLRIAFQAAGALSIERERDTELSLLTAPLSVEEIVEQKILAACRPMAGFLFLSTPPLAVLFLRGRIEFLALVGPLLLLPPLALLAATVGTVADAWTGRRAVATILTIVGLIGLGLATSGMSAVHLSYHLREAAEATVGTDEPISFRSADPATRTAARERELASSTPEIGADQDSCWLPALAFRSRTNPFTSLDFRWWLALLLALAAGGCWMLRHAGNAAYLRRVGRIEGLFEMGLPPRRPRRKRPPPAPSPEEIDDDPFADLPEPSPE